MLTECRTDRNVELMRRVSANDLSAIGELYDRFGILIYRIAFRFLPNRADAEEAVRRVFVGLWRHSREFESAESTLANWVLRYSWKHLIHQTEASRGTKESAWPT
ncbi:ECF RNA polymerase sigma factor SigK [Phycisphaerales bacterium]|nr:ECF RNA polymerase sigma factor SigK [Phycisphaerales bacterium]